MSVREKEEDKIEQGGKGRRRQEWERGMNGKEIGMGVRDEW